MPDGRVIGDRCHYFQGTDLSGWAGWVIWASNGGFMHQRHCHMIQGQPRLSPLPRLRCDMQRLAQVTPAGSKLLARRRDAAKDTEMVDSIDGAVELARERQALVGV